MEKQSKFIVGILSIAIAIVLFACTPPKVNDDDNDENRTWVVYKLMAPEGTNEVYFGYSVAMSDNGNTIIIGAIEDDDKATNSGAAYWLRTTDNGATWMTSKFVAYDGTNYAEFGNAASISADGNTVIVGAMQDRENGFDSGSAYWFRTTDNGTNWITNKFIIPDGVAYDNFGSSVAMSDDGNTVVIGAAGDDFKGSAYWLRTTDNGTNWTTNKLVAYDGEAYDYFGYSVAISDDGNTAIVGAHNDEDNGNNSGSAYWFRTTDGTNWITNKIIAYDGTNDDVFGCSVGISADGNTIIVGACWDDDALGAAYWLHTSDDGTSWTTNKFTPTSTEIHGHFGASVAISDDGNTVIIGTPRNTQSGSAYWFRSSDGGATWISDMFMPNDYQYCNDFGEKVAISSNGNKCIIGASGRSVIGDGNLGSVYWATSE